MMTSIHAHVKKKTMITRSTLFYTLALSALIASCKEVNIADKQSLEGTLYYYNNVHCFDFVKRCELEILKVKNLDTLIYVNTSQCHGTYEEVHGKLTRINDTIFHVRPFKHFRQRGNREMPFKVEKGHLVFLCDSSSINSNFQIEYLNKQIRQFKIYATVNLFPIEEEFFNKHSDRIYLSFEHLNPVVDERIEIVSRYSEPRSIASFMRIVHPEEFYVLIKNDRIASLNMAISNGNSNGVKFNLDKMPPGFTLPKGRKLYE